MTPAGARHLMPALAAVGPGLARMAALRQTMGQTEDALARERLAPEIARLERRVTPIGRVLNILLILSAVGMAVARYVG